MTDMERYAIISSDGLYRYALSRIWDPGRKIGHVLWIMLNPSTADARTDDQTVRRCVAFSERWGCGGLTIVNLFALRSPSPRALLRAADAVGPDNDRHIRNAVDEHGRPQDYIIAAWGGWGSHEQLRARRNQVLRMLPVADTDCLTIVGTGDPGHPCRLRTDLGPVKYEFPAEAWQGEGDV